MWGRLVQNQLGSVPNSDWMGFFFLLLINLFERDFNLIGFVIKIDFFLFYHNSNWLYRIELIIRINQSHLSKLNACVNPVQPNEFEVAPHILL